MAISVIIVTFNRAKMCRNLIHALMHQTKPPFEVIVIDDYPHTPPLNLEGVRVIKNQNELGLSRSKNLGISMAKGDVLLFLDDDIRIGPDLISNVEKYFSEDISLMGGLVVPFCLSPPPNWFDIRRLGWSIGVYNEEIIGSILVVRRKILKKVGLFNPDLGRIGGSLLSWEDNDFVSRVRKAGYATLLEKNLVVEHFVPSSRLSLPYLMRRYWMEGISWKHAPHQSRTRSLLQSVIKFVPLFLFDRRRALPHLLNAIRISAYYLGS
jgi:GT2 family glycosyltransferase